MTKPYVRRAKYCLLALALTAFAAAIIIRPERYISVCFEGIKMWAVCVLPALFPFMVICGIFTSTGIAARAGLPLAKITKVFKLPPAAAPCFIMGLMSGYPAGSRTVGEFYSGGYIDKNGAKKLACLCSATGPLFAIGTVGVNMFGGGEYGLKLFAAHAAAVVVVGLTYSLLTPKTNGNAAKPVLKADVLRESFYGAVNAALTAGAFIVFFYTAAAVCGDFKLFLPFEMLLSLFTDKATAEAVCTGLVEMTGGCLQLAKAGGKLALPFAGFLVTFGGACVILQQLCYLTKTGVRPAMFIIQKFIQGVLCFLILYIIQ